MPPKGSSSKRKAKADEDRSESEVQKEEQEDDYDDSQKSNGKSKPAKKAKVQKEPVKPLDPTLPTNITFPIDLKLEAKPAGTTRLACWNVCGINSCIKKGFDFYVKAENPDVLIITETKVDKEVDHDVLKNRYPVCAYTQPCTPLYTYCACRCPSQVPDMGSRPEERPVWDSCLLENQTQTSEARFADSRRGYNFR